MSKQKGEGDLGCAIIILVIIFVVIMGGVPETREWLKELVR